MGNAGLLALLFMFDLTWTMRSKMAGVPLMDLGALRRICLGWMRITYLMRETSTGA
jgi:hypothetical protein